MMPALDKLAPVTRQLASFASIAARVDRTVLRRLRLELVDGDATVESDLWFSDIVAARSGDEIVFATEYLDDLRDLLVTSRKLEAARAIVKAVHRSAAPLLVLEEDLIELGVTNAPRDTIQAKLGSALATIRNRSERAADVSDWALSALPRLPPSVRGTAAAWSLAIAAEARLGFSVDLGEQTAIDEVVLDPKTAMTSLRVQLTRDALLIGASLGADLRIPATTPRVVRVELDGDAETVSVSAGERRQLPIDDRKSVVITSLKGDRWRVRAETAHGVAPLTSAENGRWILVDGTPALELPWEDNQLAMALGRALADHGFSLVTLGRRGVSHVVARSFMEALEPCGFTSGIYPLLHIVEPDTRADFERGRALFPPPQTAPTASALDHADAVFAIGETVSGLEDAARAQQLRYRALSAPAPTDNPTRIATRAVERLLEQLGAVAPAPPTAAAVIQLAATALDQRDLATYERTLARVEREATRLRLDAVALLTDPRPSHRLVGYKLRRDLSPELLLAALLQERTTVREFWETRTLFAALTGSSLRGSSHRESETSASVSAMAIAAAYASIELELRVDKHIDPGGELKSLVVEALGRMRAGGRARRLAASAASYERLRRELPASDERTEEMTQLVERLCGEYQDADIPEIKVWFSSGHAGQRIVALSLLLSSGNPAGFEHVESAIVGSLSKFEQYTALRVVHKMIPQLRAAHVVTLRATLERERRRGGSITPGDQPTWSLSANLVETLSASIHAPATPGFGRALVVGQQRVTLELERALRSAGYEVKHLENEPGAEVLVPELLEDLRAHAERPLLFAYAGESRVADDALILTIGAEPISFADIERFFKHAAHVIFVLDCDHAAVSLAPVQERSTIRARRTGAWLYSCGDKEKADPRSPFISALARSLERRAALGPVHVREAFKDIRDAMEAEGRQQQPGLAIYADDPDVVFGGTVLESQTKA